MSAVWFRLPGNTRLAMEESARQRRNCWGWSCGVVLSAALVCLGATAQSPIWDSQKPVTVANKAAFDQDYGKLPLSFEANSGQSYPKVRFVSRGSGYSLFLTDSAAVLSLRKPDEASHLNARSRSGPRVKKASTTDVVRMELAGASHDLHVTGDTQLPGTANYFIGNDPAKWQANVPTYARVKYDHVYPGVDLVYYGNQRQLEYDFVVAPNADPRPIQLHFAGASKLKIEGNGDLEVIAKNGQIAFHRPVLYQQIAGERKEIEGSFRLLADNNVTFQLGGYDHTRELVIDPTLEYSTYLGSTGSDSGQGIAVDASGNAYVTGYTYSTAFPTTKGSYQASSPYTSNTGRSAVFISKLNAAGTALVYSTYLTGTQNHCSSNGNVLTQGDFGTAVALDSSGNAYVTGGTCANDFPTTASAFQTTDTGATHHAPNAFITKLNASGSALVYSTYLGGSGAGFSGDWANAIALDATGDAYVTGQTSSSDFPVTKGAFQVTNPNASGRNSAFVAKINPTGTALVYSTYLGGNGNGNGKGDSGNAIAINASGNAFVTGYVSSANFPVTTGVYQPTNKAAAKSLTDAFVTELNPTGTALVFSTYLGGSGNKAGSEADSASSIALDASANVYIAGGTASTDFPVTTGAFQTKNASVTNFSNGFVSKLNPTGKALLYSTYLGGAGNANCGGDAVGGLALDGQDDVYLTGTACSNNFSVTSGAYQTTNKAFANNSPTAFLTSLNSTGSALVYSTYFGGSGITANVNGDSGNAIAFSNGNAYFAGTTESTNFPVSSSAYQKTNKATSGNSNAFIARFAFATATTTSLVTDGTPQKLGVKVTFTADVTGGAGSGTPTGTVDFSVDGGTAIAETLDDTGHAAYSTTTLAEGTHTIIASYLGDATHLASKSATVTETIYGAISTLTVVSGSGQSGPINTAYSLPLVVLAKDAKGDVIPGLAVTWSGTGLKFSSTTSATGANGQASVTATPTSSGSLTAKATSGSLTAIFTLTATNGTVATPSVSQTITIGDATAGATVYYTTNGTTPTTSSTKYTGPITITATETLKFIAVLPGDTSSAVRTVATTIQ